MLFALAVSLGAVAGGVYIGLWTAGVLCHESLSSIIPLPPLDQEQGQSSQTRGTSPAEAEEGVNDQEPIAVAPNFARSETVERVGVNSE